MVLTTRIAGFAVRPLSPADIDEWCRLVEQNREHLTRLGEDLPVLHAESLRLMFSDTSSGALHLGMFMEGDLVGYVLLSPQRELKGEDLLDSQHRFGLGYWVAAAFEGHGLTTEACRVAITFARSHLGANDFWSGALRVNIASLRVLEKLGFSIVREFPERLRLRLAELGE